MDLSIVILNYNTCQLTVAALRSIFVSETMYNYEVIVVDNNSKDQSVSEISNQFPQVRMVVNPENWGFSKGNNQGIVIAQGRYILLLNSDTVIQPDTLDIMLRFMDCHPKVGAAGCKLILPDGTLDKACKRGFPTPSASFYYAFGISKLFPNNPCFNQYQLSHLDPDGEYPVDCLVGAFMLIRREVIEQVGMLDEDFFMYGEDIDWCYRIKQAGWVNYYYPRTHIIHYKGASSRKKPYKIVYEFHRAMYLFHRKHYQKKYPWVVNFAVYSGIALKFVAALVINKIRKSTR
jgi:GT2 family glycosyltransferase